MKVVGKVLHLTLLVLLESLKLARHLLAMGLFSSLQLALYLLPMSLLHQLLPGPELGQMGLQYCTRDVLTMQKVYM